MSHLMGAGPTLLGAVALLFGIAVSPGEAVQRDRIFCAGEAVTIVGTAGPDLISGTESRDVIAGLGGDDFINGLGGNDVICGGEGNDTIRGGRGADLIIGDAGIDVILGGNGADQIYGGEGNDKLYGGPKPDSVSGGSGNDKVYGGGGDDVLNGGMGNDRLRGRLGVDLLDGSDGTDNCRGETEHNCEVAHLGNRIDILNGPDTVEMAAGAPFHVWHGWACNPIETDCAMNGAETVSFLLYVDDVEQAATGLELATIVNEWRQKRWIFNFPDGMAGAHVFRGVWLENGELSNEMTVTVTFS